MKKYWKFATIITVLVAVVALVGATAIYAQGPANNGAAGQPARAVQPAPQRVVHYGRQGPRVRPGE